MHKTDTTELIAQWGAPLDQHLRTLALTHRSWAFEHNTEHNERLEFLGDSILGFISAQWIFLNNPQHSEGEMSKIKAASVSEKALAHVARTLNLGSYIRLGRGEEITGGRDKDSILSDTVEALIAATYLQYGMEKTAQVVQRHIVPEIEYARELGPALDWRTAFEEAARERGIANVDELRYEVTGTGPDHARVYSASLFLGSDYWAEGTATSQKAAKLQACANAYQRLMARPVADPEAGDDHS